MDIKERLGNRIRILRKERNLSQEKLALLAGIDRAYFQKVERGRKNASIEVINKIAIGLGISLQVLFAFEEETKWRLKKEKI